MDKKRPFSSLRNEDCLDDYVEPNPAKKLKGDERTMSEDNTEFVHQPEEEIKKEVLYDEDETYWKDFLKWTEDGDSVKKEEIDVKEETEDGPQECSGLICSS